MSWHDLDSPALASSSDLQVAERMIRAVAAGDPAMERSRQRVLSALSGQPDLAHRTVRPGHLTGSALVVNEDGTLMLLILHAKLGRWLQPGGHADGEANLARVALLEATEETGIADLRLWLPALDVDIHRVAPPGEDPHLHYDVRFLAVAPLGSTTHPNHESRELRWVRWEDLGGLEPDEGLIRLAQRGRDLTRRRGWRSQASC